MKPLTAKEKALFVKIDEPIVIGSLRMTRHVVVTYYNGKVIGIDTITAWRRFIESCSTPFIYTFELRNMWF